MSAASALGGACPMSAASALGGACPMSAASALGATDFFYPDAF